jgi:hypothetical protein
MCFAASTGICVRWIIEEPIYDLSRHDSLEHIVSNEMSEVFQGEVVDEGLYSENVEMSEVFKIEVGDEGVQLDDKAADSVI